MKSIVLLSLLASSALAADDAPDAERSALSRVAAPPTWNELMQALAMVSDPEGRDVYMPALEKAVKPMRAGDFDTADALLAEATGANPDAAVVLYFRGMARTMFDRPDAHEPLAKAYAIAPDNVEVARAYAEALMDAGQLDEADAVFREAHAREPRYPGIASLWGQVLFRKGDVDAGLTKLAEAAELTPDAESAWQVLFDHLIVAGLDDDLRFRAAIGAAEQLEKRDALNEARLEVLAQSLRKASRFAESVPVLQMLIERKPDHALAHVTLADALNRVGEHDLAEQYAKKAIDLGDDSGFAWHTYAAAQWKQGKTDAAVANMKKAVERDPRFGESLPEELEKLM